MKRPRTTKVLKYLNEAVTDIFNGQILTLINKTTML